MMERQTHIDRVAAVFVVACCLFWGFQQVLIKAVVGEVPPLWQASIRFAGATLLLYGLASGAWLARTASPSIEASAAPSSTASWNLRSAISRSQGKA